MATRKKKKNNVLQLSKTLVLNRYMLSLFGVTGFEAIAEHLRDTRLEGVNENNESYFYHELKTRMLTGVNLSADQLLEYDQNIISHTQKINEKRELPIQWKYFQYLALLFTEIYLDKFFANSKGFLDDLNEYLRKWNDPNDTKVPNETGIQFLPFQYEELNKLSFWNATGSGKTLLMHVNILQYLHYQNKYHFSGGNRINRILLVTPNEGLSQQHARELETSNIAYNLFSKTTGSTYHGKNVEIIEISKLAEEDGEKTVAAGHFEQNNLVLIDEGHRGISGNAWKKRRDELSEHGFAFEYSATFGQAVAAADKKSKEVLIAEYSKNIVFDYSYKYFYYDGYGKNYRILNVPDDSNTEFVNKYLTGALLAYYQQYLIHQDKYQEMVPFNIEKPLWVFVGGTVTQGYSKKDASDVLMIVKFFRDFVRNEYTFSDYISQLLAGRDGILDDNNSSVFKNYFSYINQYTTKGASIYADILNKIFNSPISGANLYVDNLKGIEGELGLRIGEADYFGIINIGDDNKLFKQFQSEGIPGLEKDFFTSLFQAINNKDSKINLLIGARKFTEGWNSWRVSTMGLMNVGKSEGSQIIQLFGRGVRLKGYNWSLKRTSKLDHYTDDDVKIPEHINHLETLNVFGIRANYMKQFKEFLEEEGLPANDRNFEEITVPVMFTVKFKDQKLKIIKPKEGIDFKKDKTVTLAFNDFMKDSRLKLDWYPKVQIESSFPRKTAYDLVDTETHDIKARHLAFIDWDNVFFALQKFKNERFWYNLSIPKTSLPEIMNDTTWYDLYIPEDALKADKFEKVRIWEEITIALLKGYTQKYYNHYKSDYLSKHMETIELDSNHPNFIEEYKMAIEESQEDIIRKVKELKELIGKVSFEEEMRIATGFTVFEFLQHLYKPLLYIDEKRYRDVVKISPVALNHGEMLFVKDLKDYFENNQDAINNKQLFLLRNQSRKGVGFFDAHGFYPDFILWLVEGQHQHIAFIDPKGLRQVTGFSAPKLNFYKTIKETIEARIGDSDVNLHSFILSLTPSRELRHWKGQHDIKDFNARNIYFRHEQEGEYISAILSTMIKNVEIQ